MVEPYRFNGPVPEAVKQLRDRRRFRGSQLYETVKRGRRRDAEKRMNSAISLSVQQLQSSSGNCPAPLPEESSGLDLNGLPSRPLQGSADHLQVPRSPVPPPLPEGSQ